jgi:O-Antigen ligase
MDIALKNISSIVLLACLGILIGIFVSIEPVIFSILIISIAFVLIVLPMPIKYSLMLMSAIIFIDISPVVFAGSYIRLHQLLFLIYLLQFAFLVVKTKQIQLDVPLKWPLFFWIGTFFLSYFHALSKHDFWVIIIGQTYLYVFYLVIYNHVTQLKPLEYEKIIKIFINSGVFIAFLGLLQWPLLKMGVMDNHYNNLGVPRPSSLLREPDWYGLTCVYFAILLLTFQINKDKIIKFKKTKFLICFLGAVLSLSRASWLSFIVGIMVLFLLAKTINKIRLIKFSSIILSATVFIALSLYLFVPELFEVLYNRINPQTSLMTDDGAANSRLASIQIMKDFIRYHPFVGNGVGGMNWISQTDYIINDYIDGEINGGRGNANIILTSLFDSGIIGTTFLVSFLIGYIVILMRAYKGTKNYIILGFLVSFVLLLTDFMFNNGIRFAFVWFHLGISLAFIANINKKEYKEHFNIPN